MGLLSFLSAKNTADKALNIADKATTGIIAGIDKLWFTDEEKAETSKEITKAHLELMKTLNDENTARSITRRYLAIMFSGVFLLLLVFSAIIWFWMPTWAAHVLLCVKSLSTTVFAITVFYFGFYGVKQVTSKKNK